MPEHILVVDDDKQMRYMLRSALEEEGLEVTLCKDAESALDALARQSFAVVLLDLRLPGMDGLDALPKILERDPHLPVLVITAYGTREKALRAIQAGAYDFFEKPFQMDEFLVILRRALEKRTLTREVHSLAARFDHRLQIENIVGQSQPMREIFDLLNRVVDTDVTVLIRGESGTGKELIAEAIHRNSSRYDKPFVRVNCVAIPDGLLESELFGHEKGSFTGATDARPGRFQHAHGGTIFLDEVGEMPPGAQAKLLRVLQQKEVDRVGADEPVKIDVRVLAATSKDLTRAVREGSFRDDLYFRLNVVSIEIPPLRRRPDDIPLLLDHFVTRAARRHGRRLDGFSPEATDLLLAYPWPGNVRELENAVEHAAVLADGPLMDPTCLPAHVLGAEVQVTDEPALLPGQSLDQYLQDAERRLICAALRKTHGHQARAADLLGISARVLWHRIKKHGIRIEDFKQDA